MISKIDKNSVRKARHDRVRKKVSGTAQRPRLDVFRSLSNMYAQLIDDEAGVTLAAASTMEKEIAAAVAEMTKTEAAKYVGGVVAKRAIEKDIKVAVFDRGGYLYTGRVAAVADGAREAGLEL